MAPTFSKILPKTRALLPTAALPSFMPTVTALRGGEVSDLIEKSYEWCVNLGAPAALVAGAVVATIYETMRSGDLDISPQDNKKTRFGKKLCRLLLLSAFALEVMSIFVTTVTGTMLLSRPLEEMAHLVPVTETTTPLGFLQDNFEFEYLTARITFLQGLLNWLAAIGLGYAIPTPEEEPSTRAVNRFLGQSLLVSMILMLAFYNSHMNFYGNYAHMLCRYIKVTYFRFVHRWPPRPLMVLFVPASVRALYLGFKAFQDYRADDEAARSTNR